MYPFRVFLSYSSAERELAEQIVSVLQQTGLFVMWDHALVPGQPFTEEIKTQISRCHLFIPLLTRKSLPKPWVHQETGYAMGVGVPILPIVIGNIAPVALIQQLQAIRIGEDVGQLRSVLTEGLVDARIEDGAKTAHPNYESIDHPERRTQMIVQYARDVQRRGGGRIRQRGAMSSFALPELPPAHSIWRERDGRVQRSRFLYEQLCQERLVLGEVVARYGCDIVIDPTVELKAYGSEARRIRLEQLRKFLLDEERYPDVRVAVRPRTEPGNLLIVGDWFYAESIMPVDGAGYRQTLVTWHAPTVWARIKEFDREFTNILKSQGITNEQSRSKAAAAIEAEISTSSSAG
ncbi:MAG TPA: toll/interleukin-1 receptor domain-containing protein [Blastocatellia bacterium]|nr:toll/interleukin-1 receptor domain-containing protein [Blastocatellia bacterium]